MRTHTIPLPHKYSWGFNNSGQCGLGHRDPVLAPQPILEADDDSGTDQPVEAVGRDQNLATSPPFYFTLKNIGLRLSNASINPLNNISQLLNNSLFN